MIKVLYQPDVVVTVDLDDLPLLRRFRWRVRALGSTRYLMRNEAGRPVMFHRELTAAPHHLVVDHINGNGLDNSRENLRLVTQQENLRNRGRATGVSLSKRGWRAKIAFGGRGLELGFFGDRATAEAARDFAALHLWGGFGTLHGDPARLANFDILLLTPEARALVLSRGVRSLSSPSLTEGRQ